MYYTVSNNILKSDHIVWKLLFFKAIDYTTCMLHNCSLSDVLRFIYFIYILPKIGSAKFFCSEFSINVVNRSANTINLF